MVARRRAGSGASLFRWTTNEGARHGRADVQIRPAPGIHVDPGQREGGEHSVDPTRQSTVVRNFTCIPGNCPIVVGPAIGRATRRCTGIGGMLRAAMLMALMAYAQGTPIHTNPKSGSRCLTTCFSRALFILMLPTGMRQPLGATDEFTEGNAASRVCTHRTGADPQSVPQARASSRDSFAAMHGRCPWTARLHGGVMTPVDGGATGGTSVPSCSAIHSPVEPV
jgi:hypothetical protein